MFPGKYSLLKNMNNIKILRYWNEIDKTKFPVQLNFNFLVLNVPLKTEKLIIHSYFNKIFGINW